MKALIYTGPSQLAYRDMPAPAPKGDEQLVRVEYVGICGSDMHAFLGHDERRPAPLILGHEAAGVVADGPDKGRRVTVNPLVSCGECAACKAGQDNLCPDRQIISMPPREGAFAQYIAIPKQNLVDVPSGFDLQKAALCEPIACGWHAAKKCARYLGADFVKARALVQGGGAIGVGAALSLKAMGVANITITEPHAARAEFVRKAFGFDVVAELPKDGEYFDLAIDGVGFAATREVASAALRPGGVIAHIGLGSGEGGLDIRRMTLQEITFIGCYTYSMQDFKETALAMFEGRLGRLDWCDIRPLSQGARAFSDIKSGAVSHPKIILQPDAEES